MTQLLQNKLTRESGWSVLNAAFGGAFIFALNIILARALGKEGFGQWMLFISVFTIFATFSGLWIDRASRTHIARHRDDALLYSVVTESALLRATLTAAAALIMWLSANYIGEIAGRPLLGKLLTIAAPLLFMKGLIDYFGAVFVGMHRLKFLFIINFVDNFFKVAGVLAVIYLTINPYRLVTAYTVAAVLGCFTGIIILSRIVRKDDGPSEKFLAPIMKDGFAFLFINFGAMVIAELNTFVLGVYCSDAEVAYFTSAKVIISYIPGIVTALFVAAGPVFADIRGEKRADAKKLLRKLLLLTCAIILPVFIVFQVFAGTILSVMYGAEFTAAAPLLRVLGFYMVIITFSMLMVEVLDYQRLGMLRARNLVLTIIVNVILLFWLIPKHGAMGAALAQTISFVPYVLLNIYEVRKAFSAAASE